MPIRAPILTPPVHIDECSQIKLAFLGTKDRAPGIPSKEAILVLWNPSASGVQK